MAEQEKQEPGPGPQGGYQYEDGEWVEAMFEPASANTWWERVLILNRTLILTAEGHWHPVYRVQNKGQTQWMAGEGELRRPA